MTMTLQETFFSFRRFRSLLHKEMVEHGKQYLLRTLTIFGLLLFFMLCIGLQACKRYTRYPTDFTADPAWGELWPLFFIALSLCGMIAASLTMEPMQHKTGRIAHLLLPATPFEKFAVRWIIHTVGFLAVFLLSFLAADLLRVLLFRAIYPNVQLTVPFDFLHLVDERGGNYAPFREAEPLWLCTAIYLVDQAWFVLGSVVWPRKSFMKSTVSLTVIGCLYVGMIRLADLYIEEHGMTLDPTWRFPALHSEETFLRMVTGLLLAITLFLWVLAYYRTKEDEIIERL